jgi:hypothetical protein
VGSLSTFDLLALVVSVIAYVPLVRSIYTSKARPTISLWISWGLMDTAILAGMIAAGEIGWQMVAYVIGVGFVLGVCIYKKASLGWTRLDTICLLIVIVAILMWALSGDPDMAIIFSLIAAVVATIPFARNLWIDPAREIMSPWVLFLIGGIFGVMAIQ